MFAPNPKRISPSFKQAATSKRQVFQNTWPTFLNLVQSTPQPILTHHVYIKRRKPLNRALNRTQEMYRIAETDWSLNRTLKMKRFVILTRRLELYLIVNLVGCLIRAACLSSCWRYRPYRRWRRRRYLRFGAYR
jgi:hypothetical protein